jgi:predicted DNA-binding protein (MmcQ/YjbR family)
MNIEEARIYALSLPHVTEDMPFGDDYLTIRVMGKIFMCINLARPDRLTMKCEPDKAVDLRDRYVEITGAWHWNKRHWNDVRLVHGALSDDFVRHLIRHSYAQVVKGLPMKVRRMYPEMQGVE